MSANEYISKHTNVEKLLDHYDFDSVKYDGDMIRSSCKLHGGNNPTAFVMNPDTGLWYCHTGDCGGGDLFTLVQRMENMSFGQAVSWLASFSNLDIGDMVIQERKESYIKEMIKFIRIMKHKRYPNHFDPFEVQDELKNVKQFRNFNPETLEKFKLKYASHITLEKKDGSLFTLKHRLVFPIYFNEKQVGVSLRRINKGDKPKWFHQPARIATGHLLYNYDNVQEADTLVICEGITDVWAFDEIGVPAVATFGAHITDQQYRLLLQTGADLIMAFDGDKTGRTSTQKARKQFKNKTTLYSVGFGDGQDPESVSRKELLALYEQRSRI